MEKIYVYKEYCDENAYGEEKIVIFENKKDAEAYLKESVEYAYGIAWKRIQSELELTESDTFEPDFVSISSDGLTSYWIIEEKEITPSKRNAPGIKIHARVTKEIELSEEQAESLVNLLCDCTENNNVDDVLKMFTDGITSGNYEKGYVPGAWLYEDLISQLPNEETKTYFDENHGDLCDLEL